MNWLNPFGQINLQLAIIHANQILILDKLNTLIKQEISMAIDLSKITAEVANNTSVVRVR